jgi:putative PIN family toxin of toxin-antitoxin system
MRSADPGPSVVLDTNQIVSGVISRRGLPHQILRAWQRGEFYAITSDDLVVELTDVLARPRISRRFALHHAEIDALIEALAAAAVQPMPLEALPVHCRDAADDAVLACALGANVDYIVTGDEDLLVLDGHPALGSLRIVTPRAFLTILEQLTGDA